MKVNVTAPVRIDIGGGVTDIPELSYHVGTALVNVAVDLYEDPACVVRRSIDVEACYSRDHRSHLFFNDRELDVNAVLDDFAFIQAIFKSFLMRSHAAEKGIVLKVWNSLPKGTGLGGSAVLSLGIFASLRQIQYQDSGGMKLIQEAHYFETVELGIQGGFQDYIAAYFGGCNYIDFPSLKAVDLSSLPNLGQKLPAAIEAFLNANMIFVIQRSENISSSIIVEDEVRNFLHDTTAMTAQLQAIKKSNKALYALLRQPDIGSGYWDGLAREINTSWDAQKSLSPLIDNRYMRKVEQVVKPLVYGLRGPGAGGNSLFLIAKPTSRDKLIAQLKVFEREVVILYGHVNNAGLQITTSQDA